MDSTYSALPLNSAIELQQHKTTTATGQPPSPNQKILAKSLQDHYDNGIDDGLDYDDLPLILESSNEHAATGSGIAGAVFNLATSVIGAGIMALPATMKVLGLVLGVLLIVMMGVLSEFSIELLIRFSAHCKASSYGGVVQAALGHPSRILAEICIIINNAGIMVVYLIIIGDVMSGSMDHIGVMDQWLGNGVWDHRKLVILVVLVLFLAPLCVMEKIDSLSLTSAASVALAVIFVVVSCVIAVIKLIEGSVKIPRLTPDFGSRAAILDLLVVIPIMTNAYVCHFNVQPIYHELKGRSPKKMNRVGRITTVLCVAIYASTAVSGYLLFGKDTESDVLTNFDKDLGIRFSSILNYIVRVGYVLHLILVFPVIHFSLRQTVGTLLFKGSVPKGRKTTLPLTMVLLGLIYLGSTMVPNIWVAFKFTGATTGMSLGFIFPSLIALRLNKQGNSLGHGEKLLSWSMLVLAVSVSIVGVVGNIYSIKGQSG